MKLGISSFKRAWYFRVATRLGGLALLAIYFVSKDKGYVPTESIPVMLAMAAVVIVAFYFYITGIKKPYAVINGDTLTINNTNIRKSDVKSMEYYIKNDSHHILKSNIVGYSEWELHLNKEDVNLNNLAVYKFIHDNFYPVRLVK